MTFTALPDFARATGNEIIILLVSLTVRVFNLLTEADRSIRIYVRIKFGCRKFKD